MIAYSLAGGRYFRAHPEERCPESYQLELLRLTGAAVEDVAALVEQQRPDLLLMQEATAPLDALPALIGGCFHRLPLPARIHGLATWSPHESTPPSTLALPESWMPGRMPPRLAQVVRIGGITLANVHLSHGQIRTGNNLPALCARSTEPLRWSVTTTLSGRSCCRASEMSDRVRRPMSCATSCRSASTAAWCAVCFAPTGLRA